VRLPANHQKHNSALHNRPAENREIRVRLASERLSSLLPPTAMCLVTSAARCLYETRLGLNKGQLEPVGYDDGKHPFNQSKGQTRKQTRLLKILAAVVAGGMALNTTFAQTSTTTTTTAGSTAASSTTTTTTLNGTGTISTIDPTSDFILFRGETTTEPLRYYYSKNTTVVDPEGRTVAWSALRPDMPVTYSYVREGDRMVITKVTLTRPISYYEKKETTTTTTTTRP
jgi:hypothetical protein